jgi:hypothetical protein
LIIDSALTALTGYSWNSPHLSWLDIIRKKS